MIPTDNQIFSLWDKYHLPEIKRRHVQLVADVSNYFSKRYKEKFGEGSINILLVRAAAILNDIDKAAQILPGEHHPDACVRILINEGMKEVASVVASHPLHAILDPARSPKTPEEMFLFLADKMVKHEIISVDRRFALWKKEKPKSDILQVLTETYQRVKHLEQRVFRLLDINQSDIEQLAQREQVAYNG